MLKTVKFGQLQRARNLVSQGGTFLQFFTCTPTPYNLFTCKYGSKMESGRVSNSNTCQTRVGNMIAKGVLDRVLHGAIYLRFLFQRNHFRTVHNEMDFIHIEIHFMVLPHLLKTMVYPHIFPRQDWYLLVTYTYL